MTLSAGSACTTALTTKLTRLSKLSMSQPKLLTAWGGRMHYDPFPFSLIPPDLPLQARHAQKAGLCRRAGWGLGMPCAATCILLACRMGMSCGQVWEVSEQQKDSSRACMASWTVACPSARLASLAHQAKRAEHAAADVSRERRVSSWHTHG